MTTFKRQIITSLVKNVKHVKHLKQKLKKNKGGKRVGICICITGLLWFTAEANTTL